MLRIAPQDEVWLSASPISKKETHAYRIRRRRQHERAALERVAPCMQGYVDRGVYAGVSTLIARRGHIVHAQQFGFRDKEARLPMTADTIFRLYSMTKPIVCTALMTFLEEGRIRLVDPVAAYLPAFGRVKVLGPEGVLVRRSGRS